MIPWCISVMFLCISKEDYELRFLFLLSFLFFFLSQQNFILQNSSAGLLKLVRPDFSLEFALLEEKTKW